MRLHNTHFRRQITPIWDVVKQIRNQVEASLGAYSEEIRDASKMTASELIENAVKYGVSISQDTGIRFDFTADDRQILIVVANKVLSQDDYQEVQRLMEAIATAASLEELYLQRLHTLLEHPKLKKTQLGLFRIAYEGQFTLSYAYAQDILTISARRAI